MISTMELSTEIPTVVRPGSLETYRGRQWRRFEAIYCGSTDRNEQIFFRRKVMPKRIQQLFAGARELMGEWFNGAKRTVSVKSKAINKKTKTTNNQRLI